MKKLALLSVIFMTISFLYAQNKFEVSPCFYDELIKFQNAETPHFKTVVDRTYDEMLRKSVLQTRGDEVYTIKVVFHVVYKNAEENISDARVKDQINVLNESFRRKNADTTNTRPIFKPVAADAHIEFKLDRIIRVKTTQLFKPNLLSTTNQIPNQVKQTVQGGSDAIDPDRYMNIWVCKIEPMEILFLQLGSVLGFAYPPAGLANWPDGASAPSKNLDGVVVDYRTVGKAGLLYDYPGRDVPLALQGRTLVHETGHYLGLRHIWGDGSLLGSSCNGEDGISDTPKASSQSKFDCDKTKNSCPDSPVDLPDMIENYMDYSDESCMNLFTNGQVGMMRSVLNGPRKLLIDKAISASAELTTFQASLTPNPSSGNVYFDWRENQPYELRISDTYGRLVRRYANTTSQALDFSQMTNGLYLFEIKSANRFQVVKWVLSK